MNIIFSKWTPNTCTVFLFPPIFTTLLCIRFHYFSRPSDVLRTKITWRNFSLVSIICRINYQHLKPYDYIIAYFYIISCRWWLFGSTRSGCCVSFLLRAWLRILYQFPWLQHTLQISSLSNKCLSLSILFFSTKFRSAPVTIRTHISKRIFGYFHFPYHSWFYSPSFLY